MSQPNRPNATTPLQNSVSAPPPPQQGPSASAAQAPGMQAPLPTGIVPQASAAQPEKIVFGLRQDANNPQNVVFNDDYEKRLPEDSYCREAAPNARIWRVYNEEAAAFDVVYVGRARDGLDVMLVFAGLFSAVVTSFLVQVSQSLQADYTSMSAILLYDLVSVQLSIADGASSRLNITVPSINPLQPFRPDSNTVWVNGLWVVSLTMSLVVALSAVLVKQWLHHYTSIPSGTPGTRSHLRQYRFDGLQKWRVNVISGLFPIIMHVSLVLFLVGLVLFFIPLRTSLACAVGVITVILCLLYLVSSALPIFFPQCPYQTPLTDFMHYTFFASRNASRSMFKYMQPFVTIFQARVYRLFSRGAQSQSDGGSDGIDMNESLSAMPDPSGGSLASLDALEMTAVMSIYDKLSVDALDWLVNVSSNPIVHSLVVQSIGGLPPGIKAYAQLTWEGQSEVQEVRDRLVMQNPDLYVSKNVEERLYRSFCFVPQGSKFSHFRVALDEPRLAAAKFMLMRANDGFGDVESVLRRLFFTSHNVELHPLLWTGMVQSLTDVLLPGGKFLTSSQDSAHIISLLLPVCEDRRQLGELDPHKTTVTLREALVYRSDDFSDSVQECLLSMLKSTVDDEIPPTLPLHYRILYKAGKYALGSIGSELSASQPDVGSCRHVQLLTDVLVSMQSEFYVIHEEHFYFLRPMFDFLLTVIDSPICDYNTGGWREPTLHELLNASLSSILQLSDLFLQHEFVFPSFHRLLQVPARYLSNWQSLPSLSVSLTSSLIEQALALGVEAMYAEFLDGDWMSMLAERYIVDLLFVNQYSLWTPPFCAFVRGLNSLGTAAARKHFFDYCQQPRQFLIMFIMIASEDFPESSNVDALLALCPQDSCLHTHRATLDDIIHWCQAPDRENLPFPPSLENFFNGKVVQEYDKRRDISLDEALRNLFALKCTRFEWAARTIISEAAPEPPHGRA